MDDKITKKTVIYITILILLIGGYLTYLILQNTVFNKNIKELNENINSQLKEMFFKNFIENKSINILRNYPRYLKAVEVRLEKYRKDPSKDAEKAEEINKLTIKLNREKAARRGVEDPRLEEFENLLQELRVSLFAQELRTPMPVSVKRLNKVWDSLIGSSRGF